MASTDRRPIAGFFFNWAPVILWASLIFVFSTEIFSAAHTAGIFEALLPQLFPGLSAGEIQRIHAVTRKLGHFSEYFVLALLLMRALRNEIRNESIRRPLLLSIVFTILYAASDEFHQSFVPSRSASVFDVMIDTTGGICGTLLSYLRNHRTKTLSNPP